MTGQEDNSPMRYLLFCVLAILAAVVLILGCQLVNGGLRQAYAEGQVRTVLEFSDHALNETDPSKVAEDLEGILGFYPSGTYQKQGSQLDILVERVRLHEAKRVMSHLKTLTNQVNGSLHGKYVEALDVLERRSKNNFVP